MMTIRHSNPCKPTQWQTVASFKTSMAIQDRARGALSPTKTIAGEDQTAGITPERIYKITQEESICQGMTFNKTHTLIDERFYRNICDCKLWIDKILKVESNKLKIKTIQIRVEITYLTTFQIIIICI